jgi:hypothetical protein
MKRLVPYNAGIFAGIVFFGPGDWPELRGCNTRETNSALHNLGVNKLFRINTSKSVSK